MIEQREVEAELAAIDREYQERSRNDFLCFVRGLKIPSAYGPCIFDDCMASYQMECYELLAPSLHAIRDGRIPPKRRFWIERTKGAGKDSDIAVCLIWLLAFTSRPLLIQVGAADKDQAGIVRRRMDDIVHYNPWLQQYVDIQQYGAVSLQNSSVQLVILAADVHGSHGETPDVLLVNELSHVNRWEFVENLLDNADKVPMGLVIIATNAGFKGTKAYVWRENAIKNPDKWTTRIWTIPAPWISESDLKDAKERNLPSRFNRLWYGKWASGKGDALSEDDIERCLKRHNGPLSKPEKDWEYVAGLDLGVSHDHAGFVILGVNYRLARVRIAWMRGWAPNPKTREVDLIAVADTVFSMSQHFRLRWIGYDPTEARLMAQQLHRRNVPMSPYSFSAPKNLTDMANGLVQIIGILEGYDDEDGRLRRDFGKLNVVEKTYGCKLEAVSDEFGHADVGVALSIAVPKALELLAGRGIGLADDESVVFDEEKDLTKEEVKALPEDLRGFYDDYDMEEKDDDRDIEDLSRYDIG